MERSRYDFPAPANYSHNTTPSQSSLDAICLPRNSLENAKRALTENNFDRVVVVDGILDPSNMRSVAEAVSVDGKLFEEGATTIRSAMLASRPLEFLLVRFISIGRYMDGQSPDKNTRDQIAGTLATEQAIATKGSLNGFVGTRAIQFYGHNYFTVEQQAIFLESTTHPDTHGIRLSSRGIWTGLLLNETDGKKHPQPCWLKASPPFSKAEFLPLTTRNFPLGNDGKTEADRIHSLPPNPIPLNLDAINKASALHYAASLLIASALTWSQYIAFLRIFVLRHISVEHGLEDLPTSTTTANNEQTAENLRLLYQTRAHLVDAIAYFDEILQFWDMVQGNQSQSGLFSVSSDYRDLRDKAIYVSALCSERIGGINNYLTLRTSFQALRESDRMKRLTYLAIVYAAVSLSSSIFGMNVAGLGGKVGWYYFFVVAVVLTVAVLLFERCFTWCGRLWIETIAPWWHRFVARNKDVTVGLFRYLMRLHWKM